MRSDLLVSVGVENLLMQEDSLEVMRAELYDERSIREELEAFRPDVLVLDESLLVPDLSTLLRLFKDYSDLRIVIINTSSNWLHIYDNYNIKIKNASDLIAVIQERYNRSPSYLQ